MRPILAAAFGLVACRADPPPPSPPAASTPAIAPRQPIEQLTFESRVAVGSCARGAEWTDRFTIDARPVTDAEYQACIAKGPCPHLPESDWGSMHRAYVRRTGAETYCHWRRGRLPTFAEWQIAASAGGDLDCDGSACTRVGTNGFTYWVDAVFMEWVSDGGCLADATQFVAVALEHRGTGSLVGGDLGASFRCVRNSEQPFE
jgi:hypothetical protein